MLKFLLGAAAGFVGAMATAEANGLNNNPTGGSVNLKEYLPHVGDLTVANIGDGDRFIKFIPVQLFGGKRWSLLVAADIEDVPFTEEG